MRARSERRGRGWPRIACNPNANGTGRAWKPAPTRTRPEPARRTTGRAWKPAPTRTRPEPARRTTGRAWKPAPTPSAGNTRRRGQPGGRGSPPLLLVYSGEVGSVELLLSGCVQGRLLAAMIAAARRPRGPDPWLSSAGKCSGSAASAPRTPGRSGPSSHSGARNPASGARRSQLAGHGFANTHLPAMHAKLFAGQVGIGGTTQFAGNDTSLQ